MSFLGSFWNDFLTKLKEIKGEKSVLYSVLKQTRPAELTEEKIVINCDNQGVKKFLDPKLKEIEDVVYQGFKKKLSVEFAIAPTIKKKATTPLLSFEPTTEDLFTRSGLNKKYTLENFAVSSTNQVAYAAAQAVVNNIGTAYNPLFLYGGVGVGKTHLAQSVAKKILENDKNKRVFFCPGETFTNELIEAIRDKTTPRFRRKYRLLNLLIVDDIQFIAGKTHIQEDFFHTFNSIVSAGGQIILTSDRPPDAIKNLEDRLRSRFSGGLTVDIQPPDFELRTAILLIKAKEKNINLDIEAAKVISERVSDSRALEGTLLSLYAKIVGKKDLVDLESVDEFFSNNEEKNHVKRLTPSDVIRAVCTYYNIRQSRLKSKERTDSVALPRQVAMYLIRKELGLKLAETAELLRRNDHTTVLHAQEKISSLMMKDQSFKKDVDNIVQSLKSST
ncbi:chromosomal replication initiator protein DnaA [Patescibacteria group bacterium]|nr:chromosomal replication initiator protein DnaA [Patescibacteria group bacterium]